MFPKFSTWRIDSLRIASQLNQSSLLHKLSSCSLPQLKTLQLEQQRIESVEGLARMEMPRLEYMRLSTCFYIRQQPTDQPQISQERALGVELPQHGRQLHQGNTPTHPAEDPEDEIRLHRVVAISRQGHRPSASCEAGNHGDEDCHQTQCQIPPAVPGTQESKGMISSIQSNALLSFRNTLVRLTFLDISF